MSARCIPNTPSCRRSGATRTGARAARGGRRGRLRVRADLARRRRGAQHLRRDRGADARRRLHVTRTILPGNTFWNNWLGYPFSATEWNMRPLGVQTYQLAYRSGVAWNETGFSDERFDALLDEALGLADEDERRELMREMQQILQDSGVIVQPYWRNIYRHMTEDVRGLVMHPTFEIHLERTWLDA
jgi:hypothetical protein